MRAIAPAIVAVAFCGASPAQERETLEFRKDKIEVPACGPAYSGSLEGGAVTVVPGEPICFSIESGPQGIRLTLPPVDAEPKDLLVLKLWQDRETKQSFLSIHNPLDQFLVYQAYILRTGRSDREYTTTCPVLSRRDGFEMWSYGIEEVTLSTLSLEPEQDKMECR